MPHASASGQALLLTRWPRVSHDPVPPGDVPADLNGSWNTTSPEASFASMKNRCVCWSNWTETGNDGGSVVVGAGAGAGTAGFGAPPAGNYAAEVGAASWLGGAATDGVAPI